MSPGANRLMFNSEMWREQPAEYQDEEVLELDLDSGVIRRITAEPGNRSHNSSSTLHAVLPRASTYHLWVIRGQHEIAGKDLDFAQVAKKKTERRMEVASLMQCFVGTVHSVIAPAAPARQNRFSVILGQSLSTQTAPASPPPPRVPRGRGNRGNRCDTAAA